MGRANRRGETPAGRVFRGLAGSLLAQRDARLIGFPVDDFLNREKDILNREKDILNRPAEVVEDVVPQCTRVWGLPTGMWYREKGVPNVFGAASGQQLPEHIERPPDAAGLFAIYPGD